MREDLVECKIVSGTRKIMPKDPVENEIRYGKVLTGETADFQIVFNNKTAGTIKFAKIDIKSDIKENVKISAIDFVPLTTFPDSPTDEYYSACDIGLVPDLLREFRPTDLCLYSNLNKACYVSIDTCGIPAGIYDIFFVLHDDVRVYCECKYTLEVSGCLLDGSDVILTNWMHCDCIADYHALEVFSEEFYNVFGQYLKEYLDIGFNMIYTPLFTPPLDTYVGGERRTVQLVDVKTENGKYVFSFEKLDKFIDFCTEKGILFFEFSHLFTQWGGKACPKICVEKEGKVEKFFGWDTPSDSEDYKNFLDAFLPELVGFLRKKGVFEKCFFHLTDEPRENDVAAYCKFREIVKKHIGEMRIIDAVSEYEFIEKGFVDVGVPLICAYGGIREKYAGDLFVYYCGGPTDNYYTNRLLCMPLNRTRILGTQLYLNDAAGFLHWGFNFYNTALSYGAIDPYKETDAGGMFPSGDAFIVYPDRENNGVRSTLRAKAIKRGFEDYRLLKTLEKIEGKQFVKNMLKAAGYEGFSVYPKNECLHNEFFAKVRELIEQNDK